MLFRERSKEKKLKYQLQQTDENVMIVLDKNGLENRKKIGDVLKDEEEHIGTVNCITKVWKQIIILLFSFK